jgi:UDP-glucose 4-epimerase
MRIVVTGGAGFIGSHLVDLLARKGNDLMVLDDLSTGNLDSIHDWLQRKQPRVHFDLCDIRNADHVHCSLEAFRPEAICHLAAQPAISVAWKHPRLTAEVNEIGTLNLIDAAKEYGAKRIVFASTSAVYGDRPGALYEFDACVPVTPYGISKAAAEAYLQVLYPNCVILRLGNVYGPRQKPVGSNQIVPLIFRHFLYGEDFKIIGDGRQKRDYVFVEDVANAFQFALYGDAGTYNIASGHQTSVNALCALLEGLYGAQGYRWEHTDENDARQSVNLCISAARKGLGWNPGVSLQDGLARTAEWWNGRK